MGGYRCRVGQKWSHALLRQTEGAGDFLHRPVRGREQRRHARDLIVHSVCAVRGRERERRHARTLVCVWTGKDSVQHQGYVCVRRKRRELPSDEKSSLGERERERERERSVIANSQTLPSSRRHSFPPWGNIWCFNRERLSLSPLSSLPLSSLSSNRNDDSRGKCDCG